MKMRTFGVLGVMAASLAEWSCTSDPTGTIGGQPFSVADSATFVNTNRGLANIDLTDFAGTCSAGSVYPKSSRVLQFLLADADADTPPMQPGTFTVHTLEDPVTGLYAECLVTSYDSACSASGVYCTSGRVTLTTVDPSATGRLAGDYDVLLGSDHLVGSFDSPNCENVTEDLPTCM